MTKSTNNIVDMEAVRQRQLDQAATDGQQQALMKQLESIDAFEAAAPAKFLAAWKQAVLLAGPAFFNATPESVYRATDREGLRPNWGAIDKAFGTLSHGEKVLIANMYCLFNPSVGQTLIERLPDLANPVDQFRLLDLEVRNLLCELLRWDTGW